MVIVHLSGGFGNQLYSYAFGYAMAKMRNDTFAIDTAIQDAPWFFRNPDILNLNILYQKRISYFIGKTFWDRAVKNRIAFRGAIGWTTKVIKESAGTSKADVNDYHERCKSYKNIYLRGNWASERHFENVKNDIFAMYTFKKELGHSAAVVADEISSQPASVTIHCRRGDYVGLGACMTEDYYFRAIEYIVSKLKNPVFYCFSEDIEWMKKAFAKLPYDIRYPEYVSDDKGMEDFRLLCMGKHQIVANSSYSWWAAYLNPNPQKIVIVPKNGVSCETGWLELPYETA